MSNFKYDNLKQIDKVHQNQPQKRLLWVDFCKGMAMIAVITDHCYGLIYTNRVIQYHTIFSVTLFVFIGGINYAISLQKSNGNHIKNIFQRIQRIIYPFLLSTLCWSIFYEKGKFDMVNFLSMVINFKATGAYYFICFFMQLIALSPVIYYFVNNYNNHISHLCIVISSGIMSILFKKYTFILALHGGGKYLFGGSYLFVFTLGIIFFRYIEEIIRYYKGIIIFVVAIILLIYIELSN
ncbi:MAG: acyltransferase [Desulfobulbaceae bacterium]|nr:acyltransferase [Desulfobulbaceae bacterium]